MSGLIILRRYSGIKKPPEGGFSNLTYVRIRRDEAETGSASDDRP
jgi:hypothetical protein